MSQKYKKDEEDRVYRMAFSIYDKAMEANHGSISDAAAVFTVCLALAFEDFDKENMQEVLFVTNKNVQSIWEYFQTLKTKYKKKEK